MTHQFIELIKKPIRSFAALFRIKNSIIRKNHHTPWKTNIEFYNLYSKIKDHSLCTIERLYELWTLVEQIKNLDGHIIEIGTWKGGSGAIIASQLKKYNPNNTVYLCDTFDGVVKTGKKDTVYKDGARKASKETVHHLLQRLNLSNTKVLAGIFPEETSHNIDQNDLFKLCHIDVDVYQSAKDIMDWVWPKIIVGGIVIFDDYGDTNCDGIITFVNEEKNKTDRLFIHNTNGHAIFIKK